MAGGGGLSCREAVDPPKLLLNQSEGLLFLFTTPESIECDEITEVERYKLAGMFCVDLFLEGISGGWFLLESVKR